MLVSSIFSFSNNVLKRLPCQLINNQHNVEIHYQFIHLFIKRSIITARCNNLSPAGAFSCDQCHFSLFEQVYKTTFSLTLSNTSPGLYLSTVQVFWKHCGKRRNCSLRAISPLLTVFLLVSVTFCHYNLKLLSANSEFGSLKFVVWERINKQFLNGL